MTKLHESWRVALGLQLNERLPQHDCVLASLLISTLPSASEVVRGGKRLDALRERWRSLPQVSTAGAVFVAEQSPGMHHRMIVAQLARVGSLRLLADLLSFPLGRWQDLHLRRGDSLVASSLREERLVYVADRKLPSMRECFGETVPLSDSLFAFLGDLHAR